MKEACVQNFSPERPLGSDVEVVKGHIFHVYYNILLAIVFTLMYLDLQNNYQNNINSPTINIKSEKRHQL